MVTTKTVNPSLQGLGQYMTVTVVMAMLLLYTCRLRDLSSRVDYIVISCKRRNCAFTLSVEVILYDCKNANGKSGKWLKDYQIGYSEDQTP